MSSCCFCRHLYCIDGWLAILGFSKSQLNEVLKMTREDWAQSPWKRKTTLNDDSLLIGVLIVDNDQVAWLTRHSCWWTTASSESCYLILFLLWIKRLVCWLVGWFVFFKECFCWSCVLCHLRMGRDKSLKCLQTVVLPSKCCTVECVTLSFLLAGWYV